MKMLSFHLQGLMFCQETISDGQIVVEAGEADKVQLVLNGVSITNSDGPAIEIRSADKVFLTLAEGSENMLSDGEAYVLAERRG